MNIESPMAEQRNTRIQLAILNTAARLFGGLSVVAGAISVLTGFFASEDRLFYLVLGVMAIVWGIAFLRVKPIRAEDLPRK
jgi:hypothetical protein